MTDRSMRRCTLTAEYAITSQDVRNCVAMQQIRYDCLFQYGIKSEEAFYYVEAKARAENIGVGVENFLYMKGGVLLAKRQFRDNDTSDGSQSHREMMV